MEAMVVQTCMPKLSESGDTLGGRDRASWEMRLQIMIQLVWRYTWRP